MRISPEALLTGVHMVVVEIESPSSIHYRRRAYYNLPSAQRAVDRAVERGQSAQLILCKLIPVVGTSE